MRALIIDDSQAMRSIIARMLRQSGFEVMEAADGVAGLEVVKATPGIGVVLVDWNMPEMSGLEFVRAVRRDLGIRDLPLMMVTTETEVGQVVKALAAGANEYLMKPFSRDALVEKLELIGVGPAACQRSES